VPQQSPLFVDSLPERHQFTIPFERNPYDLIQMEPRRRSLTLSDRRENRRTDSGNQWFPRHVNLLLVEKLENSEGAGSAAWGVIDRRGTVKRQASHPLVRELSDSFRSSQTEGLYGNDVVAAAQAVVAGVRVLVSVHGCPCGTDFGRSEFAGGQFEDSEEQQNRGETSS